MAQTSTNDVSNNIVMFPQTAWVLLVRQFFEASTEKMQSLTFILNIIKYHYLLSKGQWFKTTVPLARAIEHICGPVW